MKAPLIIIILVMSFKAAAQQQVHLTDTGINELYLGMNIDDASNVVPFASYSDKRLFNVWPSVTAYYYVNVPQGDTGNVPNVKYIFVCTGADKTIKRFSLFLDDSDNKVVDALCELYGKYNVRGEGTFGTAYYVWWTKSGTSIRVAKSFRERLVTGFPVTFLDFDSGNDERLEGYSIDFKAYPEQKNNWLE